MTPVLNGAFPRARHDFAARPEGAVAQLGERLVRNEEVRGSIPLGSTSLHPCNGWLSCSTDRNSRCHTYVTARVAWLRFVSGETSGRFRFGALTANRSPRRSTSSRTRRLGPVHMEVQADRHDLPSDPKVLQQVTLGELVVRYRDTVSSRKRSRDRERYMLETLLAHPISRKRLSEVTGADLAAYRDDQLKDIKPGSVKRELAPISHMFELARAEWGLPLRDNPARRIQFKGADRRRERRLRDGELPRLIEAAKACRSPLVGVIIRLAVETGMRRGEILAIRRDDIDLGRRTLLIPHTKNGDARTIPLTSLAAHLLRQTNYDPVFPMSANAFRLAWERVRKRAGIKGCPCTYSPPTTLVGPSGSPIPVSFPVPNCPRSRPSPCRPGAQKARSLAATTDAGAAEGRTPSPQR